MSNIPDAQRDAAVQAAVEAIKMANKTLADLGVIASPKGRDPRARAPDGGPLSEAHTFLKSHRLPTMKVHRLDENGAPMLDHGEITINTKDFDPDFFVEIETKRSRTRTPTPASPVVEEGAPTRSPPSRSALSMMSMSNLRAQPEVADLDEVPKSKSELVDAILAAR